MHQKTTKKRNIFKRFLENRSGSYATAAAMLMFPIAGAVGAAIDYSAYYNLKTDLQNAVDAATLAAAKEFVTSLDSSKNVNVNEGSLETLALNYFNSNYEGNLESDGIDFDLSFSTSSVQNLDGDRVGLALVGTANTNYDLIFAKFLGQEDLKLNVTAEVNIANKTIETAFVFDASGSMTDNDTFQKSTKAAHDMLHDLKQFALALSKASGADTEYARFALVPFAWGVNVGATNRGASWIDNDGAAKHHHDHFDWTEGYPDATESDGKWQDKGTALHRFKLFDDIGENWAGCVDARAYPYNLDDTGASAANPDTLFVPMFAPDEPDNLGNPEVTYKNNYAADQHASQGGGGNGNGKKDDPVEEPAGLSPTNKADQFARLKWTSKYDSKNVTTKNNDPEGPNTNCFEYEIFTLNNQFGLTNAEISHLNNTFATSKTIGSGDDDGATNIQQGIVWGWRTLSSSAPFTEGRPENDPTNQKVMIVITDGINSYSSSTNLTESEYGAYGYLSDDRLDEGILFPASMSSTEKLDSLTLSTCTAAKNDGVAIYIVGYGVVQGSSADQMLSSCSGGPDEGPYYFQVNDGTIQGAMTEILRQLVDIRLTG